MAWVPCTLATAWVTAVLEILRMKLIRMSGARGWRRGYQRVADDVSATTVTPAEAPSQIHSYHRLILRHVLD